MANFEAATEFNLAINNIGMIQELSELVAQTALFAHPEVMKYLVRENGDGTWRPKCRRKDAGIARKGYDINNDIYLDDNSIANVAIKKALGYAPNTFVGYEVCHIWFNSCYDVRYHTCIANLVLLPRAIASLSDYSDQVMKMLQYRAYELYECWYPKEYIVKGAIINPTQPQKPDYYPKNWKNVFEYSDQVKKFLNNRRSK